MVYLLPARLQAPFYVTRDVLMNGQSVAQDIGTVLAPRQMASIDTAINRTIKQTYSMQIHSAFLCYVVMLVGREW